MPKEITDTNASAKVSACLTSIEKEINNIYSTLSFRNLNNALVGGLRGSRLYMISSINSFDRTTFVLNIADNVAADNSESAGREVLFYSLETSSDELILKSLIRRMYVDCFCNGCSDSALTYTNIFKEHHSYQNILPQLESIGKVYSDKIGKNIYIQDGKHIVGDKGLVDVLSHLKSSLVKFSKYNCKPLVIVDYLELLPSYSDGHFSYEQSIYENVYALKRIAVEYNVPVIVVCSSSIGGIIDYGADVVLKLHLAANYAKVSIQSERPKLPNEAKSEYPREVLKVKLEIIKDKIFGFGGEIYFNYYPQYNYFKEKEA